MINLPLMRSAIYKCNLDAGTAEHLFLLQYLLRKVQYISEDR